MFVVVVWGLLGFLIGAISEALAPVRESGELGLSSLLGTTGACLGGWVATYCNLNDPNMIPGSTMALVGAVVMLGLRRVFSVRSGLHD